MKNAAHRFDICKRPIFPYKQRKKIPMLYYTSTLYKKKVKTPFFLQFFKNFQKIKYDFSKKQNSGCYLFFTAQFPCRIK